MTLNDIVRLPSLFVGDGDRLVCLGDSLTERSDAYFPLIKPILEVLGVELINPVSAVIKPPTPVSVHPSPSRNSR